MATLLALAHQLRGKGCLEGIPYVFFSIFFDLYLNYHPSCRIMDDLNVLKKRCNRDML